MFFSLLEDFRKFRQLNHVGLFHALANTRSKTSECCYFNQLLRQCGKVGTVNRPNDYQSNVDKWKGQRLFIAYHSDQQYLVRLENLEKDFICS